MCFLKYIFKKNTIKVYEEMTFSEFYDKYSQLLMPRVSKDRFLRSNRYRRLFSNGTIRCGASVVIPDEIVI